MLTTGDLRFLFAAAPHGDWRGVLHLQDAGAPLDAWPQMKLMDDEQRGGIDLTRFYTPPGQLLDGKLPDD